MESAFGRLEMCVCGEGYKITGKTVVVRKNFLNATSHYNYLCILFGERWGMVC